MGKTKKIHIKDEFCRTEGDKKKRRKKKPKLNNYITPNKVKRALIDRIKAHQQKKKEKPIEPSPAFVADFTKTMSYLSSVVDNKKTIKKERKQRRRRKRNIVENATPIETKIRNNDDPPYGILKGGKKPLYSQYKKTLKRSPVIILPPQTNKIVPQVQERQKKLQALRKEMKISSKKIRKKRYTLGKQKRKVGILIKSRATRKKIKKEHNNLKKKKLSEIRLYLKKHGFIKIGSDAPEKILRAIYETAVLSGDVYNKNNNILLHNYIHDKKIT